MIRGTLLKTTLDCLQLAIGEDPIEIIVVNDRKDRTVPEEWITDARVRVINNPRQGAATARNFGAKAATADLLLFIDDDILVSRENILQTLELHRTNRKACYNFNWIYPEDLLQELEQTKFGRFVLANDLHRYEGWVQDINWKQEQPVIGVSKLAAFYFSIERSVFTASGGFDENFVHQGVEDDEFSMRLRTQNIALRIVTDAFVYHNERDRQTLRSRTFRLQIGAMNKAIAFGMGMKEYRMDYAPSRIRLLNFIRLLKPVLLSAAYSLPNRRTFDKLYSRLAHILVAICIYDGFVKRKKSW